MTGFAYDPKSEAREESDMVRRERAQERHEVQGGIGDIMCYHVIEKEEFAGHGRLYSRFVLPPGTSIGWHVHEGETEPYYILAGEGTFTDSDGSVHLVHKGDCCIIEEGHGHSIANNGAEDLEFMALIYNV